MTAEEINQTVDNLKLLGKEEIIDGAFQLFIDNQIVLSELEIILNKLDYKVPDGFFELPKDQIKKYHLHVARQIEFTDKGPLTIERQIFNHAYFYELAEAAKKNKKITESLIAYTAKLDNVALTILAMQQVKIKNITYAQLHSNWLEYSEKYNKKTLYEFYMSVMGLSSCKNKATMLDQLITYMGKDTGFNLDLNLEFVKFAFGVEYILSSLNPKVANTIKVKFLVYNPEYLNPKDYNQTLENGKTLINKHKAMFKKNAIKQMVDYYKKNKDILDSFNDNGYRAIYYSIIEEAL